MDVVEDVAQIFNMNRSTNNETDDEQTQTE